MQTCPPRSHVQHARRAPQRRRRRPAPAPQRQARDPRQPDRASCTPASRCSRASSATTTRSSRSSSTRSCRATTSSCSACAARRRAASCARSSTCSTSRSRSCPGCEIHDDPLAPLCAACRARVARGRRRPADRLAAARRALRREARDARRHDRRHGRRHRSDQGGAGGPAARRRADDALRPAAARQPRHLRHQRAARPRRQDPGRPVQHPAGRRRPDQGLPGPPAARRAAGLHGEPRGLHGARQDHHAAQGPHRLGDPHALSRDAPARDGDHRAGSVDRARRRPATSTIPALRARGRRGSRVPGARRIARSTSAPASASGCRSRRSSTSSRTPSAARSSTGEALVVPRVTDLYAALPVDHRQVRARVRRRAARRRPRRARPHPRGGRQRLHAASSTASTREQVVEWFDLGGTLPLDDTLAGRRADRASRAACRACASSPSTPASTAGAPAPAVASAIDFVLEGLYAQKKISRSDERGYPAAEPPTRAARRRDEPTIERDIRCRAGRRSITTESQSSAGNDRSREAER